MWKHKNKKRGKKSNGKNTGKSEWYFAYAYILILFIKVNCPREICMPSRVCSFALLLLVSEA